MLHCEECDAVAVDDASGWSAHRFRDPDDPDRIHVVVYCPRCSARELEGEPPERGS
jgi:hypothetical protein